MRESRQSFWVGLFVLVGLAALCVLLVMFGRTGFWMRKADAYVLNVRFDRAPGIRQGTIVTIGGIQVGRVQRVGFVDPTRFQAGVNVVIGFDDAETRIRKDARARANEPGLGEGRPPIVIMPGSPNQPFLASGGTIPGEIGSAMESLIPKEIVANFDKTATRIAEAAAALTPVLQDLHEVLQPRDVAAVDAPGGPPGNLSTAIARMDTGFKHINDVIGDPQVKSQVKDTIENIHGISEDGKVVVTDLKQGVIEFRDASAKAKTMVADASAAIKNIDDHADRVARSLTDDLDIASRVLTRLDTLFAKTDRGEGTLGRLFVDDRLYESLVLTFRRLAETTQDFRLLIKDWQKGKIRIGL